jgi:hypothetical protein
MVLLEPNLSAFAWWEEDDAYTDSLGTLQPERSFAAGRSSAGAVIRYPMSLAAGEFVPFVSFNADYYFSSDDAYATSLPVFDGIAARGGAGFGLRFDRATVDLTTEQTLGDDFGLLTGRTQVRIKF